LYGIYINSLLKLISLIIVQYLSGLLVRHKDVKVNYTRKINHFALFFIPAFIDLMIPVEKSLMGLYISGIIAVGIMLVYIQPIRSRISLINTMFLSFDRPEDRPYTIWWLVTQLAVGYAVLVPMSILFYVNGLQGLILIPILIGTVGDGLAEPVGVRFGKHKYKTYAFFSKRKYTRSLEGSACVFITSIIVVIAFHSQFSSTQFIVALLSIPILMTLAEAFAPHTWDTPFLFLSGYLSLYGIVNFIY